MNMQTVNSSLIKAVGYDQSFEVLRIQFHDGTYDYYGVPKYMHENIMSAFSKSRYYAVYIKDSFAYSKVVKVRELSY